MAGAIHGHAQHGDLLVQEFMASGWVDAAAEAAACVGGTTRSGGLGYGETDTLEALVVEAAKRIDQHLMDVIHKRVVETAIRASNAQYEDRGNT
ncbi:hypothetical protein HPP92_028622 [Vanilla planifolia]|uniref:Uncharacterized protein n=1 Tax=Vanilla planifolia TaxID=51239 RepID=A0A835P707_VANPL|nr:hypothetical protein HPP92_028622 [Vanilla planifolia]